MKSKIYSTIAILMLLIGTIAFAVHFAPSVQAVEPPYYLTIETNPPGLPVTEPAIGTYKYDVEHWVNCTAMLTYIDGDVKYIFDHWEVSPYSGDFSVGPGQMWVHVDQNKTATAVYKVQYKFTVIYPWSADWLEQFVPAIWQEGVGFVSGSGANGTYWAWIDKYAKVQAGLKRSDGGIWRGTPWIWGRHYEECVSFVNWTGLGFYISGDGYAWSNPCLINMTGPKSATAEWKFVYYLTVTSNVPPEPAGEDWYDENKVVTLTANPIVVNWAREWRLDYWEVDGVPVPGNPINVTMNTNHTASAFYKCWVFLWLGDDIGNASGIADNGKWYQEGVPYTFLAPDPVPIDANHRWGFLHWGKYPGYAWTNASNPLTICFDATWAGYTLRAVYHMQYRLRIFSSPPEAPDEPVFLYPDSALSGWYWAGSTATLKALPIIEIDATSRWKFTKWTADHAPGWEYTGTNYTTTMDQPKNFTAHYDLEHFAKWDVSPAGLTFPGGWGPGSIWVKNGSTIGWWAPQYDTTTYVFHHWVVNDVAYDVGKNDLSPWLVTGPIIGTAYYVNKTKIFMDPSYHEETAHAYCKEFEVTVYASNFDAERKVDGKPMDIYGFDIGIKWDKTLLELKSVSLNLANFFAPNDYFIGENKIDNAVGTYTLIATVKGNYTGFSGTKAIFIMKFHVIYDPCYPNSAVTWIYFEHGVLANHLEQQIVPELGWYNCYYMIKTVKPMIEVRNAADKTNAIIVHKNVPQTEFDIEVYLNNGVKVSDFYVILSYPKDYIEAISVAIGDYLKPPYVIYYWYIDKWNGKIYVQVAQDSGVPLQNCSGVLFTVHFKVVKAVYYTMGPHILTGDIKIDYAELSVYCPTYFVQKTTDDNLGTKKATYTYNPWPGDLDFDGCVTVLDLQLIMDNYGKTGPPGANYDVTYNGETNLFDLVFVAKRFGTCAP